MAREDLRLSWSFVVYVGEGRHPLSDSVEVIGLREMAGELARLQ